MLKYEFALQFRHGFYYAYLFFSGMVIWILTNLPDNAKSVSSTVLIFSDPSLFGLYMVAAIVLLERGQNVLQALFVTPMKIHHYIVSKAISLTCIALMTSFIINVSSFGRDFNPWMLAIGVSCTSVFFICVGMGVSIRARSFNSFLLTSIVYLTILFIPLVEYLGLGHGIGFYLFPSSASLRLLDLAFHPGSPWLVAYCVLNLTVWVAAAYVWAYRRIRHYIIFQAGENR